MAKSIQVSAKWLKSIPRSQMVYPDGWNNRAKYFFWSTYTRFHPYVRDFVVRIGLVKHFGQQPFLIGYVAKGISIRSFIEHLIEIGYSNHFVALRDDGELIGLRITDGFTRQYHIRVFADGSVRGHYEYTPEAHPFLHLNEVGFENRKDVFLEQIGSVIVPATDRETLSATTQFYIKYRSPNKAWGTLWKMIKGRSVANISTGSDRK